MTSDSTVDEPYQSARDLPTFREMEEGLAGLRKLLPLARTDQRRDLERKISETQVVMDRLAVVVDTFYEKLGPRNWIFTSELNLEKMESIASLSVVEEAEKALIEYYRSGNHVEFGLRRMARFEALRPRLPLLRKAMVDYENGRHYSTVLVLIAAMDGFVNDLEKQARRGLHAREAGEMFGWNSVIGHHLGLTHAHESFIKSSKKTQTKEIVDLHRHGIVHGMLTNFDNAVVSSKAWNRLFALGDWADARLAKARQADLPPELSLDDVLQQYGEARAQRARSERFKPYSCGSDDVRCEVLSAASDFFTRWKKEQWAPLGAHFIQSGKNRLSAGELAREAKDLFEGVQLSDATVDRVEHFGSMGAYVHVTLVVDGITRKVKLRWLHVDRDFEMIDEMESGRWALSPYGPRTFLGPKR